MIKSNILCLIDLINIWELSTRLSLSPFCLQLIVLCFFLFIIFLLKFCLYLKIVFCYCFNLRVFLLFSFIWQINDYFLFIIMWVGWCVRHGMERCCWRWCLLVVSSNKILKWRTYSTIWTTVKIRSHFVMLTTS